ncbi:MAG TPA: hypothetical protein PKE54_05020, partial [Candidatus Obscuribacter sp.]|nr:hypothetical protein [Candidatus Obscuribacter sp.]
MSDNNDKTCEASAPALPEVPHCNICGARSVLADALASLGKAVADVHCLKLQGSLFSFKSSGK